ncbi:VirD2 components relaxase [Candidatus Burkholderia humilis]|nr:VirD2 components relaxase [Candidatus Burkholderia humilis]
MSRAIGTRRLIRHPLQRAIQARPTLLLDLASQCLLDLQLRARPQPFRRQFGGPMAEAIGNIVARDDEVAADIVTAPHDDVRVGIVGVPVIDRHPLQPGSQIGFHPRHEVTGVGPQIVQRGTVLGRHDEAEMMPIVDAASLEAVEIRCIGLRSIGPSRITVAAHAVALDIAEMLGEGLGAGLSMVDQQGLDGDPPRKGRQRLAGEASGGVAATEP